MDHDWPRIVVAILCRTFPDYLAAKGAHETGTKIYLGFYGMLESVWKILPESVAGGKL